MSVLLISALCVGWGLERSLSACLSNDSYAIYIKGLERSQLVLLSPALCAMLAGVLKGVSVHVHIAMVLKELDGWS